MYLTGDDAYQNMLVFAPFRNLLALDSNKESYQRISSGVSPEEIKQFDTKLEPIIFNLNNVWVILKSNHSALVQKNFFIV